jgi:hypothetical protein
MSSEKSYVSADDIRESQHSFPRPIKLPSSVIGYVADLIIAQASEKAKKISVSNPSVSSPSVSSLSFSSPSGT